MTAFIPGIITSDQMADVQKWLPNDAADNGWDTATIMDRWTGGIVTTVRAYWYDRVQQTASWLDLSDPSGSLPITQIHRQAMEILGRLAFEVRRCYICGADGNQHTPPRELW